MIRANVYSLEPLGPTAQEAVHEGIQMVATYMGQTAVVSELLVKLPLNPNGTVNPERVGFKNLEKMIDLHLMAVPVDPGEGERIGRAGIGRGWAFTNISENSTPVIRLTTSHEVAHSFGFVMPRSEQSDPDSPVHCSDAACVMHQFAIYRTIVEEQAPPPQNRFARLLRRRADKLVEPAEPIVYRSYQQFDFCQPCKIDLRTEGEKNLAKLRYARIAHHHRVV